VSCASCSRTSFSRTPRPGGCGLRLGQRQRRPQRRIVEPREHLSLPHRHPFLDVHLDELAGNLGRDSRAAPRGDVAGGVEHRGLRAGGPLRHRGRLDLDRTLAREPPPTGHTSESGDGEERDPRDPAPSGAIGFALEAQRGQIVFQVNLSISIAEPRDSFIDESASGSVRLPALTNWS
jgi:hypothetical protein